MEYKTGIESIKSYFEHIQKEKEKIELSESRFAEDFFHIRDCCFSIIEFYQKENGEILPLIEQLNSFFAVNSEELQNIDISHIAKLYNEIGFNKFVFDIFGGSTISIDILDALILHFCIILDFEEFQSIYKLYENFPCIYNLFLNYQGEKKETLIFCLLKFFNCQYQYESTYSSIFNDFNSLSQMIFNIEQNPFCNYQLSDLIVTAISSKKNSTVISQNIKLGVISNFPNIIQNLPPLVVDDYQCLLKLYHICKKMVKTDYNILLYLLDKSKILEMLLSPPLDDSDIFKKCRIDFLRICLSSDLKKPYKARLLNEKEFSFDFTMIIEISESDQISHELIESSLRLLSSFIPDLIDELNKKFRPYFIIDFAKAVLAQGQFKEKIESIELITSLIKMNYIPFIRELLKCEDEEDNENIFFSFSNEMQTDMDEIKIKLLSMIQVLWDYLQNSCHKNLRQSFNKLLLESGLQNDIEENAISDNEEIRNYSTAIMQNIIYYSNLSENTNF